MSSASASAQLRPRSCSMFQSPVQTVSRKPFAPRLVLDQPAVGQFGIVVDQHPADVEDDVTDVAHDVLPGVGDLRVMPGRAASSTFFMTVGQRLARQFVRRRPPMSFGAPRRSLPLRRRSVRGRNV